MKSLKAVTLFTVIVLMIACGYGANYSGGAVPSISQLKPDKVAAGGGDFSLTVNGNNFSTGAVVNWNGSPQTNTTYVSGDQLTVIIPGAMTADTGTVQVTVTNPASSGRYGGMPATSLPMMFTVQ